MPHPVTFVSLGPGDPELLTVKALQALKQADVIFVPATKLPHQQALASRATDIIRHWLPQAPVRLFPLPMSHERSEAIAVYDDMCLQAAACYHEGQRVVVAVEGDVSIYASIHYVLEQLQQQGVDVCQQPGITSFIAAAASASLSLIAQTERLVVIPGTATADDLEQLLATRHTVVIMKLSQCEQTVKAFMQSHPAYAYHYFENVGSPAAFYSHDPAAILPRPLLYFSLIIITKKASA